MAAEASSVGASPPLPAEMTADVSAAAANATDADSNIDVSITPVKSFDQMNLKDALLRSVYAYGFEKPSVPQERAVVPMCTGRDILLQAPSGTGKSGAFLVSLLQLIDEKVLKCQALVLSPTRELAVQSCLIGQALGHHLGIRCQSLVGGKAVRDDIEALRKGVHFVSGTPGRVLDLLTRRQLEPRDLKLLVLDEADEMLCWAKGTKLMMFDGSIKSVEDIQEKDVLMGDDSTPRTVLLGTVIKGNTQRDADLLRASGKVSGIQYVQHSKKESSCDGPSDSGLYECSFAGCSSTFATKSNKSVHENAKTKHRSSVVTHTPGMFRVVSTNKGRETWMCNGSHVLVLMINRKPWKEVPDQHGHTKYTVKRYTTKPGSSFGSVVPCHEVIGRFDEDEEAIAFMERYQTEPLIFECTVQDYMEFNREVKRDCMMFQSGLVTFPPLKLDLKTRLENVFQRIISPSEVDMAAWLIGVWLADGNKRDPVITQIQESKQSPRLAHTEVVQHIVRIYKVFYGVSEASAQMQVRLKEKESTKTIQGREYFCNNVYDVYFGNPLWRIFQSYNLPMNKHVPDSLLRDSASVRASLLTGMLDGDGSFYPEYRTYRFYAVDRHMIDGAIFLSRSLGLATGVVHLSVRVNESLEDESSILSVNIVGNELPDVIKPILTYKRCPPLEADGKNRRNQQCDGFEIHPADHADYYGFKVNGNGRILMADFVVTHNSRGFEEQVNEIFSYMPKDIQVALFSATMPPEVLEVSQKFMRNPTRILVNKENLTLDGQLQN